MIDNAWIEGTQKIANFRIHKAYPLMSENHFSLIDTQIIVESFLMLMEEYEVQRNKQSDNRNDEHRRSKGVRKVSKK